MKLRLGMSPISWSNDDLPELGGATSLETCLAETHQAGFVGTEMGGKFPKDAETLAKKLKAHGLVLVSGWYSGTLINASLDAEIARIKDQLALFKRLGAEVIVYGETFNTVQNKREMPLASRPRLGDFDIAAYGRRLTHLAEHCSTQGVRLSFHPHMGTAVETEAEIDALMQATGEAVGLLLDTGHLVFSGGDTISVLAKHGGRINHVHTKDVRAEVLAQIDRQRDSFLDAVLRGVFTVPGDGMIDYDAVMKRLFDTGYEGWVVIEAEQDPAQANPLEYAQIGYNTLHRALHAVGYGLA